MPLVYSDDDLQTMRWVKQVFDPAGLCNPGKLLPDRIELRQAAAETFRPAPVESPATAVASALGAECLLENPEEFVIDGKPAQVVAAPASVEELSELMKLAHSARWGVVPAGGGSWLASGKPLQRTDLVISTGRLATAVEHQPDDLLATVQAGTSLADLNQALAREAQWWPLDPLGGGTLGATIATASSGALAATFGAPRDLVLGLTAVLADGRVVKAGGRVVKNVAGYDMVKLFTGSFGTLGIITEAHLRLHAVPQADETRVIAADDARKLTKLATDLAASERLAPAATEILSPAAASAAGPRTDEWRMAVRWLGHRLAVKDAVQAAGALASRAGAEIEADNELWPRVTAIEKRLLPALCVRIVVPPRGTAEMIRQALLIKSATPPALVASPWLGRVWVLVSKSMYQSADVRRWARIIEEMRRVAAEAGGNVRVESAPVELRRVVDSWGHPGRAGRIGKGLKKHFDPDAILKPGFLQRDR
jgi:glycolate oxidase FAD binding subunit